MIKRGDCRTAAETPDLLIMYIRCFLCFFSFLLFDGLSVCVPTNVTFLVHIIAQTFIQKSMAAQETLIHFQSPSKCIDGLGFWQKGCPGLVIGF